MTTTFRKKTTIAVASAAALLAGGLWVRSGAEVSQVPRAEQARDRRERALPRDQMPYHPMPKAANGNLVVELCDGETSAEVEGVKEGEALTRVQAKTVSDRLMAEWRRKNPSARWDEAVAVAASGEGGSAATAEKKPAGAKTEAARQDGHIYGSFNERDEKIWAAATKQFIDEGDKIFHDAKQLGGTISVSCDMCHPNAANTHPETYPKFQVQFGRVALLRDMINWCIENPVRGKPLHDDDPKLKALEAYILAQRKGVALEYGKH